MLDINQQVSIYVKKSKSKYLVSRLTDSCALRYMLPSQSPTNAMAKPGQMNIGVKITIAPSFAKTPDAKSVTLSKAWGIGPSTARISWVHLPMILPTGVLSSHLDLY